MKKILMLDTSVGSMNQGDEIIKISIKKNWKELMEDNYIMTLATHTPMYSFFQSILYRNKLSIFKNADFKFLCGTNALYTNMLRPLPSWNINLLDCSLAKGTICLGVGIGINSKNVNWYTRTLYNNVLNHEYIHSVRDKKTQDFLEKLGFKAINTGCPTLWGLTPEHCKQIPIQKAKKAIFTLTYYEKDIENDKAMIKILLNNYSKVFFWPQCIKDIDYLKELIDISKINVVTPNIPGYERILNDGDIDYIGNRLHGGIFALQHKCRTIVVSIDYRAEKMRENYTFKCIKRDLISNNLEEMINSNWETKITGLDFNIINNWKRQFL